MWKTDRTFFRYLTYVTELTQPVSCIAPVTYPCAYTVPVELLVRMITAWVIPMAPFFLRSQWEIAKII